MRRITDLVNVSICNVPAEVIQYPKTNTSQKKNENFGSHFLYENNFKQKKKYTRIYRFVHKVQLHHCSLLEQIFLGPLVFFFQKIDNHLSDHPLLDRDVELRYMNFSSLFSYMATFK